MSCKSSLMKMASIRTTNHCRNFSTRLPLSSLDVIAKRNALFTEEKTRQASLVRRVEKIHVQYEGNPEPCKLVMNRNLSTPFDCAKHLLERIRSDAVIAYVDGQPWDMHRPLENNCELRLVNCKDADEQRIQMANKVFWRSCSFLLGYAIERAFKDDHRVMLHSWPAPSIKSGSFVYDASLPLSDWNPSQSELRLLSASVRRLNLTDTIFERLEVDGALAKRMFEDNKFKNSQVDAIAADSESSTVVLYRCGDHVDMSRGPMIANSSQIRNFDVVSVHPFDTPVGLMFRFQGIARPVQFTMSPFARNVLKERARKMNTVGLPQESTISLKDAEANLPREDEELDHQTEPTARKAAQ